MKLSAPRRRRPLRRLAGLPLPVVRSVAPCPSLRSSAPQRVQAPSKSRQVYLCQTQADQSRPPLNDSGGLPLYGAPLKGGPTLSATAANERVVALEAASSTSRPILS